ncbi:MAG: TIGR01906 family membrane protein [Clostridia bacterium]|nr:TIGR01906 family membrane protein [Clostridia bacterium]
MKHVLLSVLTALLLSLWVLASTLWNITDPWLMCSLMEHFAPPEITGLPAEEYAPVTEMISGYIAGEIDTFQHVFTADGTEYAAFNQKEQQHMADVQGLFKLCNGQAWMLILAIAIALMVEFRLFSEESPLRTFRRTLLAILAAVTAVIILAVIDFDSLFVLFHKVAFTNDLWLLNPQTDLLIRLMPIEFFISYAAIIGGIWLLGMMAMLTAASVQLRRLQNINDKGE